MSFLFEFAAPFLTATLHDEAIFSLKEAGVFPPKGLDYHVCVGPHDNVRFVEIWDSPMDFHAFKDQLFEAFTRVGVTVNTPEVQEVHEIVRR